MAKYFGPVWPTSFADFPPSEALPPLGPRRTGPAVLPRFANATPSLLLLQRDPHAGAGAMVPDPACRLLRPCHGRQGKGLYAVILRNLY